MTTEKAIRLAIEHGYKNAIGGAGIISSASFANCAEYLLDPKFWKSLGKGLGWIDATYTQGVGPVFAGRPTATIHRRDWRKKMEGLMTHLADGKSADSYFKKLLK